MLRRDLAALAAREHDVVVVGGGIHGAAAAWEAASRNLSVALLEAHDFGAGASWNSLKTIHGGLRHLQRLDVAGLRESARERRALLAIAPELVRPLAFLALEDGASRRAALGLGIVVAELLSAGRNRGVRADRRLSRGRLLSRAETAARVPGLSGSRGGGALWWDAQVDSSERLLLALLHAAVGAGAVVANRVEAVSLLREGGAVRGVAARDGLTGQAMEIRGRVVLDAAGPAAAALARSAGIARPPVPHLRAVNLVLRRAVVGEAAVGARSSGRYLFCVPWRDRSMVGTAYAPETTSGRALAAAFLQEAARAFPWARLTAADVALVHEGLVPGGPAGLWTRSRVVDHAADGAAGLLTVVAVKYTTARAVAETAIDRVFERLRRPPVASRTATTALAEARPLAGTLEQRARQAVRDEMALSLSDAVLRRLDLGSAGVPPAAEVDVVARVMAQELGWDAPRIARERAELDAFYVARTLE